MVNDQQLIDQTSQQQSLPELPDGRVKITYIGGGSRQWAPNLFRDLALCTEIEGEVALYDINYESAKLNAEFGDWVLDKNEAVGDWEFTAVEDRATALEGADFVILSTQFDPADTFVHDLDIPKRYGIYGAVAATIGPGGILRAMRTIPVYRELGAAIGEHCPDAWVLNYTNPMTWATRALYEAFPEINALGLCHEVFHAQDMLADLVGRYFDEGRPNRDEIDMNVKGINHFTWVDEAYWRGIDLFEVIDHHLEQKGALREFSVAEMADEDPFVDNNQVTFELYRRFGVLPAAGDRHLVEYAPWFIQGTMPDDLNRWGVKRTTSEYRSQHWEDDATDHQTHDVKSWMDGEEEFSLTESGEIAVDLMKTLSSGGMMKTHVNLPNRGQVSDLPEGVVVETNALIKPNNAKPITAGPLPRPVRTQLRSHVDTHETLIKAAVDGGNVDLAFQAFLNDPQVRTLQTEAARELFAELVDAEADYLGDWDLEASVVLSESNAFHS
ncbi:glycoside hydrolase family 4 [Haladaptatus pallidirubidus]|uniref:Alpha-glucosidase/alpha-galactosidase n=3 Tax=Haladaptatus pallidirubidus TaxID=1008152 RepID=A0AAV3UJN5_9EURY|nr:glycoside hydrolase family 4 [Haladaptatus pallidirubidus]